jgi:hypothetical protein
MKCDCDDASAHVHKRPAVVDPSPESHLLINLAFNPPLLDTIGRAHPGSGFEETPDNPPVTVGQFMGFFQRVEMLALSRNVNGRVCNVAHLHPQSFDVEIGKLSEEGYFFFPIQRSRVYNGFSHRHFPVDDLVPGTMSYGVIGKERDSCLDFVKASGRSDHARIGELLGYPECCTKFFSEVFPICPDPVLPSYNKPLGSIDPVDVDWMLRCDLRYWGFRAVPWFPCGPMCEASRKPASEWFKLIYECDPVMANLLFVALQNPSKWSLVNGQVVVDHPRFLGYSTSYYTPTRLEINVNPVDVEVARNL